jgi:hypothetical protein
MAVHPHRLTSPAANADLTLLATTTPGSSAVPHASWTDRLGE